MLTIEQITEAVMDAQAELQTPLGFLRVHMREDMPEVDLNVIEDRLAKTLARLHALLDALGNPMYQPATHPDVRPLEDQRQAEAPDGA